MNFSFITDDDGNSFHNFKSLEPIVQALQSLGVNAEMTGRNDIQVGAAKISGNAMVKVKDRMFSHGTLMLNSELDEVQNALKVNPAKIKSKGIKSVRKRVANIEEFLNEPINIDQFKQIILKTIFGEQQVEEYILTDEDWKISKNSVMRNTAHGIGIMVKILNIILNVKRNLIEVSFKLNLM